MDVHRSMGIFAFGILVCSLAFVPSSSAFDIYRGPTSQTLFLEEEKSFSPIALIDYPYVTGNEVVPAVSASAVVIIDVDSTVPIFQMNDREVLPGASTTKLMTALVALQQYALDDVVTMPDVEVYPSVMGLKPGERMSVQNILRGLLIQSGNDAAIALAHHHPEGYSGFIQEMNQKAIELDLKDTRYMNPSGLFEEGHVTSARDLAHLLSYAMTDSFIYQTAGQIRSIVYGESGDRHILRTTNRLLGNLSGLKGGKTGFTLESGEVLASYIERNNRKLVVVVLKSQDRFKDTEVLVEWAYSNVIWNDIRK